MSGTDSLRDLVDGLYGMAIGGVTKDRAEALIEQYGLEQRIDEVRMTLAWHGSKLPEDVVTELRRRKVDLERMKDGDAA